MCDSLCYECLETEEKTGLDIVCLLNRLSQIKSISSKRKLTLTKREKIYLCLWLIGYSNYYIAFKLTKEREPSFQELSNPELEILRKKRNLEAEMSKSVKPWIRNLIGLDEEERTPHFSSAIRYLKEESICQKSQIKYEVVKQKFYIIVEGDDPRAKLQKIIETLRERGIDLDNLI